MVTLDSDENVFEALPKRWIKVTAPVHAVSREDPDFTERTMADLPVSAVFSRTPDRLTLRHPQHPSSHR